MSIPALKEWETVLANSRSLLFAFDGSQYVAINCSPDGLLGTTLYAWDADSLSFVPVAADGDGKLLTVVDLPDPMNVAGTVDVGNFPTTQPVSGTVDVGNFPASQVVKVDPMVDYDTTLSYTDTKLTGIVVTGGGKTKTMVLGYTGENLTSIATTIS